MKTHRLRQHHCHMYFWMTHLRVLLNVFNLRVSLEDNEKNSFGESGGSQVSFLLLEAVNKKTINFRESQGPRNKVTGTFDKADMNTACPLSRHQDARKSILHVLWSFFLRQAANCS